MYKLLSGAKSVKQYRGDENLPEAKYGMKKGCGCKHSKSKYKYQKGVKKTTALNQPEEIELYFDQKDIPNTPKKKPEVNYDTENLDYYINYDLPKSLKERLNKTKAPVKKDTVPTRNTIKKDTTPVQKKTYPTVSGEKKIFIEKTPVVKAKVVPASTDRATEYFNNYAGGDMIPGKKYQLVDGKMVITDNQRWAKKKLVYDWEDLSEGEKNKVNNLYKQKRRDALQKEVDIMNKSMKYRNPVYGNSDKTFLAGQRNKEIKEIQDNVKRITSAVEGKSGYKYGTGDITIPEGSAIVTANGGKNKQAIAAYKKGNYKLLNDIIDDMPEDRVNKAGNGKKSTKGKKIEGTVKKRPVIGTNKTFTEQSALGYGGYGKEMSEEAAKKMYNLSLSDYIAAVNSGKIPKVTAELETARREAVNKGASKFTYKGKEYLSGLEEEVKPAGEGEKAKEGEKPKETSSTTTTTTTTEDKGTGNNDTFAGDKKKGNFLANIPSLAEIAARGSILSRGVENVPENYLTLGRYRYASQLPKTLQEIQLAEQAGRESARDVVAGDAGRYLAQAGNLSAARMKAANEAVIQDTLARQDILNKNVDLGNVEAQTNTGLKNQFAQQRAMSRAAYDQQLIGLGQRIDSATETSQEMANQRASDEQRLQTLRDLGVNYDIKDIDGLLKLVPKSTATKTAAKGLKKVKAYKRR